MCGEQEGSFFPGQRRGVCRGTRGIAVMELEPAS